MFEKPMKEWQKKMAINASKFRKRMPGESS